MKKTFLLFLCVFVAMNCLMANSNQQTVDTKLKGNYFKAIILDSLTKTPIEFATLSAKYVGEKEAKKYALSNEKGEVVIQNLPTGRAVINFEYLGYKKKKFTYDIKKGANDFGTLLVVEDISMIDEVVVTGVANPIMVKKDTIEYNASSFKINETDMLEELIKKLPGVEIDANGKITANGKEIKKVMIDGKTFFLDDPTLATKNLPAKIVEKVRVVERKSDQARFTGIDDGEEETVLDLGIKAGMMKGWFGNLMGGYGTKDRFESGAMIGNFTNKAQISFIGNANNTNNRGFSDMAGSMMGGMRGGRGAFGFGGNGITTSWMGGVNANTEILDGDMKLSGNALYSGTDKNIEERRSKTTMLGNGVNMYTYDNGKDNTTTDGFRFGGEIDYSISENTSILFRPNINIGSGTFNSYSDFITLMDKDSTNKGFSKNMGDNNSQQIGGSLLLRQRLGKPGRTVSLSVRYNYSNNDIIGFNISETDYFRNNIIDSTNKIDQKYLQNSLSNSIGGRLSYTEPLGKNFFVEGTYRYNYNKSNSSKDTYDKNANGVYNELVDEYTTYYENTFITQSAGLNLMKQEEKYNFTIGASMQPSTTKSVGSGRDTTYSVLNFAPSARLDYRFTNDKFLRIRYHGRTSQPSINQMLPISDNSDPLKLTIGNKDLNPEFSHNLYSEYRTNNRANMSWLSVGLDGSYTNDKIVSKKYYTPDGIQVSTYENTNKPVYSLSGRLMFNSKLWKSDFSISSFGFARYNNDVSYVAEKNNYVENVTKNFMLSETLRLTYRNDFVELRAGASITYRNAWYDVSSLDKVSTWTNGIDGSVNWTLPGGFNLTSDIRYTYYIGYNSGYNDPSTIWNAEISKTLFKDAATLKIKIYDILKDARSISRTTTENYIQDVSNNTLGQYVMFSLVWRFGNVGGFKNMRPPVGHGGMGRGPRH